LWVLADGAWVSLALKKLEGAAGCHQFFKKLLCAEDGHCLTTEVFES
jgi:hypothetical protein